MGKAIIDIILCTKANEEHRTQSLVANMLLETEAVQGRTGL